MCSLIIVRIHTESPFTCAIFVISTSNHGPIPFVDDEAWVHVIQCHELYYQMYAGMYPNCTQSYLLKIIASIFITRD